MVDFIRCQCGKENTFGEVFCPDCGTLLKNGSLVGRQFKLMKRLENKEAGWVKYKAFDRDMQRNLCLNVLVKDNHEVCQSLEEWVNQVKELVHPNIVSIFGFYIDDLLQKSFITMEDIAGRKTLRDLLTDRGKFPQEEAKRYILNVCDALSYAHAKGIYYGDIRPENLVLGANGQMRLTNFSLAKNLKKANIPITDFMLGDSHVYENLVKEAGEKGDIHRLSFIMYEMITGSLPKGKRFKIPNDVSKNFVRFLSRSLREEQVPYANIAEFRRVLEKVDQQLTECRVCGWGNNLEYPFCEMCGNALKKDLSLGNYNLKKRLEVENLLIGMKYLATDRSQNKSVVIYVFPDYLYKPEISGAIRDWCEYVKELRHENIVKVFGFFEDFSKGCKCLVREYVEEWPTLRQSLSNGRKLSEEGIMEYALQICKALAYAHSKAILHLDLRPENIILNPKNGAMLTNFRLVWTVKQKGLWRLPAAVKQYEVSEPIQRSDIYQFGLVLYEMINNCPFDEKRGFEFPDGFNEDLTNLLRKMVDRSQSTRYLNVAEVEKALVDLKIKKAATEERKAKEEEERRAKEEQEKRAEEEERKRGEEEQKVSEEERKKKEKEQKALEDKIIREIQENVEGMIALQIGEALGMKWQSLIPVLEKMIQEGKIRKAGAVYFPLQAKEEVKEGRKKREQEQKALELEKQVIKAVERSPWGLTGLQLGEMKWQSLMPILEKLVQEGRIRKAGAVYFPIRPVGVVPTEPVSLPKEIDIYEITTEYNRALAYKKLRQSFLSSFPGEGFSLGFPNISFPEEEGYYWVFPRFDSIISNYYTISPPIKAYFDFDGPHFLLNIEKLKITPAKVKKQLPPHSEWSVITHGKIKKIVSQPDTGQEKTEEEERKRREEIKTVLGWSEKMGQAEEGEGKRREEEQKVSEEERKKKEKEQKALEDKIIKKIKDSPKGIVASQIGEALGLKWQPLIPMLEKMVQEGKIRNAGAAVYFPVERIKTSEGKKIGRNEPCLCGSGKKYKKCCGR